jgi:hypothetical protein
MFQNNVPLLERLELEGFTDDREMFVQEVRERLQQEFENEHVALGYDDEAGYMGGVNGGLGPEVEESDLADGVVAFSSDEESNDSDEDGEDL